MHSALQRVILGVPLDLRLTGIIGLIGTATAATYNSSTGEGTATRGVDGANQSYVLIPTVVGASYRVDVTPANNILIRSAPAGSILVTLNASGGRQQVLLKPDTTGLYFESTTMGTVSFTIHSCRRT